MNTNTQITYIAHRVLIDHPKNKQYHKNIEGDNWKLLLQSLEQDGIIHPLVVTPTNSGNAMYRIISGHQRTRAARELGIETLPCIIEYYENETAEERALIAANRAQREYSYIDRIIIGARLLELYESKQGKDKAGKFLPSVQFAQTGLSPRDLAIKETGLHTHDIAVINKIKTLSPEKQSAIWAYIDSKNPNRTQLRTQIQALAGQVKKYKKQAGKVTNIKTKEAKLKKQEAHIRNILNQHPELVNLEQVYKAFIRCQDFMVNELSIITHLPIPADAMQTEQIRMYATLLVGMLEHYTQELKQRYIEPKEQEA